MNENPFDENGNFIPSQVQRNQPLIDFIRAWGVANGDTYIANFSPFFPGASSNTFDDDTTQETALFGEFTYNVSDRMELTAGVRVSTDDGEQRVRQPTGGIIKFYGPNYGGAQFGPGPLWEGPVTFSADRFDTGSVTTPSAAVTYHFSDEVMMFFRYAEGFTRGEEVFVPEIPETYTLEPEVVKSYELGLRSDWLDNTLRVNVTAYYGDWEGRRVSEFVDIADGFDFISVTRSSGTATAKGVEIDTAWRPGDAWSFNFNVAYLDSAYGEVGQGGEITPDTNWAYAPEWSSALGTEYEWTLGGGSLTLRGDISYQSEFQWGDRVTVQAQEPLPSYSLLNARLQYTPADADWYLALSGTNLTNEFYIISGGTSTLYGLESFEPGRPRMINMIFGMTF
jgi:iron complex outermembrane receptor protein